MEVPLDIWDDAEDYVLQHYEYRTAHEGMAAFEAYINGALAARGMDNRNTVKIIPKPLENKYEQTRL